MTRTILEGVRVVECAEMAAAPYCAKLLADLGAEVIKVEEPPDGDEARRRGPFLHDTPHQERSGLFLYLNTNKMGITLSLNTAAGRGIFKELIKETDILVEDKAPRLMKELGLDYETLEGINSRLIMTSITPFGQSGPYRDYKAYPINSYSGSGLATILSDILPEEAWPPLKPWGYLSEYDCGLSAAIATMAALYSCLFIGRGQHIDISKQESLITLERVEVCRQVNEGEGFSTVMIQGTVGGLHPCQDGYVIILTPMDHQWKALSKLMGRPDWVTDEKYKDELARAEHAPELNAQIGQWVANLTREEIYHSAQKLGCPIGMVTTVEDLLNSEQLKARGFFAEVDHPEIGRVKFPTAPYRFSKTPWRLKRPAPLLGEHNQEIYGRLGYSREDVVKMREAGII